MQATHSLARMVAVAATALGLVTGTAAQAPDAPDSSDTVDADSVRAKQAEWIESGVALREKGRDAEALDAFQRALDLGPNAAATAQVAFAEQALGRFVRAYRHLDDALADTHHPWIQQNRATLEQERAKMRERIGRLEVRVDVEGARVEVAGEDVGEAPLPGEVIVLPGSVTVEVEAEGYAPTWRQISVRAGGLSRTEIQLSPLPVAQKASERAPAPVGTASGEPTETAKTTWKETDDSVRWKPPTEPSAEPTSRRNPRWFVGVATGALMVGMSGVTWAAGERRVDRIQDDCAPNRCTQDQLDQKQKRVKRLDRTTNALWVSGAVVGLGSLAAYLFWKEERPARRVSVTGGATRRSVEMAATVRF